MKNRISSQGVLLLAGLIAAGSGPRFTTVIRTQISVGLALAYSTNTSKYRSSSKIPVSTSSYSRDDLSRAAFSR